MKQCIGICLVLAATSTGCFFEADAGGPVVVHDSGDLVVDWSIQGLKGRDQCDLGNAATIDITVVSLNGAPAGEYQQSCQAFATVIHLPQGSYSADAVLLDGAGRDRTTAVQIRSFDILGGDQLSVPIDFGADSFLAP